MSKKKISQPTVADELFLNEVMENTPSFVELRGRKRKIEWLCRGTIRKFTSILLKEGNDDKATCQAVAAILLNGYWSIKFFWWLKWRWFYYIKQYSDVELGPIIAEAKKKIPYRDYLAATILLTAMRDTMMQMTKAEADNILREQPTGKAGR